MTPRTLRKLYAAAFRSGLHGADIAKVEVSADDWVQFARMNHPLISERDALLASQRPEIRRVGSALPRDKSPSEQAERAQCSIERKASVDLGAASIDPKCEELSIDRIKMVRGFASLRRLKSLEALSVLVSDSDDQAAAKPVVKLTRLQVETVTPACLRAVMSAVAASEIEIGGAPSVVHLGAVLRSQRDVRKLTVSAPLIRGVAALKEHPLEELALGQVSLDNEWRQTFKAIAPGLRRLMVSASEPFRPEDLGELSRAKRLVQVLVPAFGELEDEWLDFAAAHGKIAFIFHSASPPSAKSETISVAEVHEGVDILKCVQGKKTQFEVADDLAARRRGFKGDNGDLEDEIRAAAKSAKKKVDWRSESDMFVARVPDLETARWVVDAALGR